MAAAGVDNFAGAGVGGGEFRIGGGELEDEAVEDVLEAGVGAFDFGGDGGGDAGAVGDGGARGAEGLTVGGDGALQVGEHRGGEVELEHLGGVGGDEFFRLVVDELGGVVEEGLAHVFEGSFLDVELGGEGLVSRLEGEGSGGSRDDEDAVDEGEQEAVLIQGDAGERCALGLGEGGKHVDAACEAGLAAGKCGEVAPNCL